MKELFDQILTEAKRVWPRMKSAQIGAETIWKDGIGFDEDPSSSIYVYEDERLHPDWCVGSEFADDLQSLLETLKQK
jgi:hypothetical protein